LPGARVPVSIALVSEPQKDKPIIPRQAWQPFTPRGVAAFSRASFTRLLFIQLTVALFVALVVLWFVALQWIPVVEHAVHAMPGTNVIRNEFLAMSNTSSLRLGGNRCLEIILDPRNAGGVSSSADISVVLTARELQLCGVLGCLDVPYQPGYVIELSRTSLEPWWGAWRKPTAALIGLGTIAALLVSWWVLGFIAAPFVKLFAFLSDRRVTFGGSWRLAMASLLPGAFLATLGIALYAFEAVDVLRLGLIYALHFVCGAAFLVTSPFFLPKGSKQNGNPFGSKAEEKSAAKNTSRDTNPFARGK
jgi:hypothetical protein